MRVPFKCPCCEGWGERFTPDYGGGHTMKVPCKPCNGSGILWSQSPVPTLPPLPISLSVPPWPQPPWPQPSTGDPIPPQFPNTCGPPEVPVVSFVP